MIGCILPGSQSANHTLNTLRYADRLKNRDNGNKVEKINFDEGLYDEIQKLEVGPSPKPVNNNGGEKKEEKKKEETTKEEKKVDKKEEKKENKKEINKKVINS